MERLYLLDTNTVGFMLKGSIPVRRRVAEVGMAHLAISTVTEGELRYGVARLPSEATRLHFALEDFFLRVANLPWDSNAARQYGQLRAALERKGHSMGSLDTMIAAHALAVGAVLVTNDRAFSRIKKLEVEDWTKGSQH